MNGVVILWNEKYGFIQAANEVTYYFNRKYVITQKISLFDEVEFDLIVSEIGKFKGGQKAINIVKSNDVELTKYTRNIGELIEWNGKYGKIKSPQQNSLVIFYETRSLYRNSKFKKGDFLVFHQVKSTKNPNDLFAMFAYHLSDEKNLDFLSQQYADSQLDEIKRLIGKIRESNSVDDHVVDFKFELKLLGFVDDYSKYVELVSLIEKYGEQNVDIAFLNDHCNDKYLIQLWENSVINNYDKELIKNYFHTTRADNKRILISKINTEDRFEILEAHYLKLSKENRLDRINNSLKTLLDLIYRNKNTQNKELYEKVLYILKARLTANELIDLWVGGYIEIVDYNFVLENFDLSNYLLIQKVIKSTDENYRVRLAEVFEKYFFEFDTETFDKEYPTLILRLKIVESEFPELFIKLQTLLINKLNKNQKFILWIYGIYILIDVLEFYRLNSKSINDYYKIRILLNPLLKNNFPEFEINTILNNITQQGLEEFIQSNPWNEILKPTNEIPAKDIYACFVNDLLKFEEIYSTIDIDVNFLSVSIFKNLYSPFEVFKLRLWLCEFIDDSLFNYFEFRIGFNELTKEEQLLFKSRSNEILALENVMIPEKESVEKCIDIIEENETSKNYIAKFYNLYFGEGYVMLKKEDGVFTSPYSVYLSSSGFNRISKNSEYKNIDFFISVNNENKIIELNGIGALFERIHTGEIEKALGRVNDEINLKSNTTLSYTENLSLKKEVIEYLNKEQVKNIPIKPVYEPKDHFRRLDENSYDLNYELTQLYTLESDLDYTIVWENADLSDDRATYVFKSNRSDIMDKLNRIADAIVSLAQLRSTLISKNKDEKLKIFKANYGFVGSIRKGRGDKLAFEKWQRKLHDLKTKSTPISPSNEEVLTLDDWTPEIYHAPSPTRRIKKINDKDIKIIDSNIFDGRTKTLSIDNEVLKKYKLIKQINKSFLEGLEM